MKRQLQNYQISEFALSKTFSDLSGDLVDQLKKHLLDSVGSMIHASDKPAILKLARQQAAIDHRNHESIFALSPDRLAQLLTALLRYPDFMDNFLGKEATCHPSDNIGSLLSAANYANASGKDFLIAMAIAYQLECRLTIEIPVMSEGIDHTLLLSYSTIAGICKLLNMPVEQTAHALSIGGSSISPMVTSRASYTYEWKGFASSFVAFNSMNIAFLARENMTGPIALFEGPKGFGEIFGMKLKYNWAREDFSLIKKCVLKSYNAEVHTQSAIEAVLELKQKHFIRPEQIEKIEVTTFLTAYHITGSGAYGNRKEVETKEQADHSLFYLVAVALIDGEVYPDQLEPDRIQRKDVQELLQKITVDTKFPLHKPIKVAGILDPYTEAYPGKMKTSVEITLSNGQKLKSEKDDFSGFHTRPMSWEAVIAKFRRITNAVIDEATQDECIRVIRNIEDLSMSSFNELLDRALSRQLHYIEN